ncbi:uncharacterized protein BO80DRAFT_430403 [Aspergillus ibericus CBS 121593]|uniref:Uncharacterized protein n=1 Tax=Aspergillus ibericus CBS 121593 TaxID=1448316 RepID=A0A395GHE8_9EURO|nr:hypothetical protein BO80DRAFT_430403 [Aspergillus ibericus CBS 121593]RAK94809.1 hypothetical protein BO80DRAFT_430403 [Aspergillus ibericus CBS 121593]
MGIALRWGTQTLTTPRPIKELEHQIDSIRPRKRAKVKESPNSRFARIEQIMETKKRLAQQLEPTRLSQLTVSIESDALCHEWQLD